jgi:hypothetical protein
LVKRCLFCGRFFVPDPRVGDRQRACKRDECKRKRKRLAHRLWCEKTPDYFKDHYIYYVKPWRERRSSQRDDKRRDRLGRAYLRLILPIRGDWKDLIKDEIHLRRVDGRTFVAYG